MVVEVLELHRGEGAFAQPVVEEEAQGGAVAEVFLGGDDRSALVGVEAGAVHAAGTGTFDGERLVAVQFAAQDRPFEEVAEDREVLVVGAGRPVAVLGV